MPFFFSDRALLRAREAGGLVRVSVRPGPVYARPLPLDVFFEEGPPAEHREFVASGVRVWVPAHLTWLAENDVAIEAAADGHLYGAIEDVRAPF
jgi:hypothetical protein